VTRYDPEPDYASLAQFRLQIRTFLKRSELAALEVGLEPQQHQMLLAVKGLPKDEAPTIGCIAERLLLKHHSTVELINRCERSELVVREHDPADHRRVLVRLTEAGEGLLLKLSQVHEEELTLLAPHLIEALESILSSRTGVRR
jgi:DNA-binding MarR family transcriptional regulator